MQLQYTGSSHFREIAKSDFNRHDGVEGEAVKVARHDIDPAQNHKNYKTVVEVSDETGQWLIDNEPGDWEEVSDDEAEKASKSSNENDEEISTSPNASDAPAGSPESSSRGPQVAKKASSTRTR